MYASVEIDSYTIEKLHEEIERLRKYYGPERSVGPVTFELEEDGFRILIGTQKNGNRAYVFDVMGEIKAEDEF
jgi:hypothetical protein